jgi:lipopolysaccharide export system protein LptA
MKVQAGEMNYQEGSGKIWLSPWSKLIRDNAVVEADTSVINLQEGHIRSVDASRGHGTDSYPNRKLEYAAEHLWVKFSEKGNVSSVAGDTNAHLVNTSASSVTTMDANHVDLEFGEVNNESVLTHVVANGNGVAESKPLPVAGKSTPETRGLRSAVIDMRMRPGGKEIESVEVPQPGTLEFLPNGPADRHRLLTGSHMWIAYAADNRIQSFRTVDATTQTDPNAEERARKREPSKTSSKNLTAQFDPKTGQLAHMEQTENFVYQEADRNARANRAVLEQQQNLILLDTNSKMWDATGSTTADRIRLDQKTGNFEAEGHVASSRQPDQKKSGSSLLSDDQPLQAVAEKMQSSDHNRRVHYQGKVVLWQGANRVKSREVLIDRANHRLTATGDVMTQFVDEPKDENGQAKKNEKGQNAAPVFTVVKADNLVYTDQDRLAHYTGSVVLTRPGLDVKGAEVRAYLAEKGADSRLERAFADGNVSIVQKTPLRTRTGTGEHAEYYTGEERILLRGGSPQLADSLTGNTRGIELTYFADDDRLLVDGNSSDPAKSLVHGRHKKQ